jgi:NAD(P)-dependent dehydrogenase (short-subunit alcohol dehydrogenase family)
MKFNFKNKTALVTGSSFGIGRSTALAFAEAGAKVVLADWVENDEVLNTIQSKGGEAIFVKCDVSSESDMKKLHETAKNTFGSIDFAINNAGIEGAMMLCQDLTNELWDKIINVNLKGVWLGMKLQIPQMIQQKGGTIVNVASIAGLIGFPMASAYVASKHAVVGLTKSAALENAQTGVRINAVCPGVIKTPMIDRSLGGNEAMEEGYKSAIPMKRFGSPEEISGTILFLCSDAASYITGQTLTPDGGWVAQ